MRTDVVLIIDWCEDGTLKDVVLLTRKDTIVSFTSLLH